MIMGGHVKQGKLARSVFGGKPDILRPFDPVRILRPLIFSQKTIETPYISLEKL